MPEQPPTLRLVEGAELDERDAEIERLRHANRELIKENTILGAELAGLQHTIRKQAAEIIGLKGENTRRLRRAAESEHITRALDRWVMLTGRQRPNVDIDGKRADLVRKAFQLGHTEPKLPCPVCDADGPVKDATCTVFDELIEAFEGLALLPWAGPKGRVPAGTRGARRYDDVEHALTSQGAKGRVVDEAVIERMRLVAREARRGDPLVLRARWEHAKAYEMHTYNLLMARLIGDRARWATETKGWVA